MEVQVGVIKLSVLSCVNVNRRHGHIRFEPAGKLGLRENTANEWYSIGVVQHSIFCQECSNLSLRPISPDIFGCKVCPGFTHEFRHL